MIITALFILSFILAGAAAGIQAGKMFAVIPYIFLIYSGVTDPAIILAVMSMIGGALILGTIGGLAAYALRERVPKKFQLLLACFIFIVTPVGYFAQKTETAQETSWVEKVISGQQQLSNPKHTIDNLEILTSASKESSVVTMTFSGPEAASYTLEYFVTDELYGEPYLMGSERLELVNGISTHSAQIDNTAVVKGYAATALNVPLSQAQIAVDENFVVKARLLPIIDSELPKETIAVAHSSVPFVSFEYPMKFQITLGVINYKFEGFRIQE